MIDSVCRCQGASVSTHAWWPCRKFLLPRKWRCVYCGETRRGRSWRR